MRILHILSQTEMTGVEVYVQDLVQYQIKNGHTVFLFSEKMHIHLPISWTSLPLSRRNILTRWASIRKLRKFIKENQIEVIHCHSRGAVRHAFWARFGLSTAMVTTLHGRQHPSISKKIFNAYGELVIAVCENVKKSSLKDLHLHKDMISVIGNPYTPMPLKSSKVEKLSSLCVAFIGRSSGPKGERFEKIGFHSFEKILSEKHKIQLICPHLDGFSNSFRIFLEDLQKKYPNRFLVSSHIKNLAETLCQFQIVVGSGRVAIESLMAQVPTLACGEYDSYGLVTRDNLSKIIESNFGDMGDDQKEIRFNPAQFHQDLLSILSKIKQFNERTPDNLTSAESIQESLQLPRSETLLQYFHSKYINPQIIRIYQRALFKRKHPKWIPILMYHKIPAQEIQSPHRIFVTAANFENHLKFFKKKKFETIHFSEIYEYIFEKNCQGPFPRKPLILSFDDGYLDNLTEGQPLLQKYDMKATLFLLANLNITENIWDTQTGDTASALMTPPQRQELDRRIWEIGSHGFDHLKLPSLSLEQLQHELRESKNTLENEFSKKITCFAYPFGVRNESVETAAKEYYDFCVNTDQGALHIADNPWSIFRVNIFPEDGPSQLNKKTSSWYRKYFFKKRGR